MTYVLLAIVAVLCLALVASVTATEIAMSSSFTYYLVKPDTFWLRVIGKDEMLSWVPAADIDEVAATPVADGGGKAFARIGALEFQIPHRCSTQDDLNRAVFELLERAS